MGVFLSLKMHKQLPEIYLFLAGFGCMYIIFIVLTFDNIITGCIFGLQTGKIAKPSVFSIIILPTVCFEVSPLHFRNLISLKVFVHDWIIWYGIYIGNIINAAFKQNLTLLWPEMTCHIVRLPVVSQHRIYKIENFSVFQTQAM